MPESAVILVDYDNVRPTREERTAGEVEANLAALIPCTVAEAARVFAVKELAFRLYGGWIDESGVQSHRAQWLITNLDWYRGRHSGTIVKPCLVTALACRPMDPLLGTVRQCKTGRRQKMVDTMIVVDAIHFCRDEGLPIMLFSDDDDLLPAALGAASMAPKVQFHWLRRRPVGSALNDAMLTRAMVSLGSASGGI
jgi:hypothetical protein